MPLSHPQPEQNEKLLSAAEMGELLNISRTTAYGLLWAGTIPSFMLGSSRKVRRSDVLAFIQRRVEEAGE